MKLVLGLLVLVGLGWVVLYYGGGYGSFDPSEQGRQAKAAIGPGMSHTQVFDICGNPRRVRKIRREVKNVGGQKIEMLVPGPPADTTRERIDERVKSGEFPLGFVIPYRYSDSVAFAVHFDSTGTVEHVEDLATMATLLQYDD